MARASLPIQPFPADIDRDYFAAYLSGFSDGESSFRLSFTSHTWCRSTPSANFTISLRRDDLGILEKIQSFWGCGLIHFTYQKTNGRKCPVAAYTVNRIGQLAGILVPHFERFPLLAKKRLDYQIWKEGVALTAGRNHPGKKRRWSTSELARFTALHDALRSQRAYDAPSVPLPPIPPAEYVPLFE